MTMTEQYEQAVRAEREAWARVREGLPGRSNHDPALWQEWLQAANKVQELAQRLRRQPS